MKDFLVSNFDAIPVNNLCELPYITMYEVLCTNKLVVEPESVILDVIVSYLENNQALSNQEVSQLIDQLRFGLLSTENLSKLCLLERFIGMEQVVQINDK